MRSLKDDYSARFNCKDDEVLFSDFSGNKYTRKEVLIYYFYLKRQIDDKNAPIAFLCNNSIDSHIVSFFLILSRYKVYYLNLSSLNSESIKSLSLEGIINVISIGKDEVKNGVLSQLPLPLKFINLPTIDSLLKWSHPSLDLAKAWHEYSEDNVGSSVFMSSGSTGTPKLIPLTYNQIRSCYNNVYCGFLHRSSYELIISVHDTSFVISLPFLFCFSAKPSSIISACSYQLQEIAVLALSRYIKSVTNYLIISVPSVYRLMISLLGSDAGIAFKNQSLISCEEPLDWDLAGSISGCNPRDFFNLYGSTEVSPWIIYLDVLDFLKSNLDVYTPILPAGRPLPNVHLEISTENELLVSSGSNFSGYINHSNETTFIEIEDVNYYNTGDLFECKNDLFFCNGRSNNAIKIAEFLSTQCL